jgi:hypothetical protein
MNLNEDIQKNLNEENKSNPNFIKEYIKLLTEQNELIKKIIKLIES